MRKLISLLLMTITTVSVMAQSSLIPDMKFRRLDTQNGLSSSQINCIFKDSRGYVWIGTPYGLNRYDGYRVRTFYSNKRDTTTMRDNYTDRIYEDKYGQLWLRQGMNYCIYNPENETFERNASRVLAEMGVEVGVEWLHIDSRKNIWVKGFDDGIYCLHPKEKKGYNVTKINKGYGMNEFHPDWGISNVAELGEWLIVLTNKGHMLALNGKKGEVDWVDNWMHDHGSPENQEYRIVIDNEENYWCSVLDYTYIYIKKEKKWYTTLGEYLAAHGIEGVPGPLMVWNIIIDKNDWLWLACDHDGLVVVDLKGKQWKQFLNNKYDETTISDNTLRYLLKTNDGSVWIGTYKNGVCQYVPGLSSLRTVELGDITTACEDKYGNYWVGTNDDGIKVYNPKTGEVISHYTKDNSNLASNIVVGSWPSKDGSLWFGSYNGGLTHCIPSDPSHATVVNYQATDNGQGLANNSVWALTEDKWGRMWFSTLGGGLQMLDPKTQKYHTWNTQNSQIPGDYLTSVGWTKKGWLITGTSNYYSLVNPVSKKLVNQTIPDSPDITVNINTTNYVIEDSRGIIWQGSTSGLTVYDPKTKFITMLDMTNGLYGSTINSIIEDKKHNIWAVTDHGVTNIVPIKQDDGTWQFNIRSYNSRDGLQKAVYNQRSTFLTRDGKVLIGGQGGLDIIDPAKLLEERNEEHVVFSGLQIFDQDIAVGQEFDGRVILDEALDVCRELSLKFNDQFTIQLATSEVSVKNNRRFAYKLEGFNENWVKTSELNPNITFNSLRAGSYTLCVRILKEDGTFGSEESQLEITIRPPLYRTRWMVLLYMIIIAAVAFFWRKRFLKKQHERMEMEQLRRDTEKKQWMSEMRKQMQEEMRLFKEKEGKVYVPDENGIVEAVEEEEVMEREKVDLVPLFRMACDDFRAPKDKEINVLFFPFVDDLNVMGDRKKLGEMLSILLNNAANFSPSKSKIKVFLEKKDDNAELRVADSGIGIPSEAMATLFDEIIGDDDTLNLHKVFDIVLGHNGTIRAEENQGGGTVFVIEIPSGMNIPVEDAVIMEE